MTAYTRLLHAGDTLAVSVAAAGSQTGPLQALIDATPTGSLLDLNGYIGSSSGTVARAMTIRGGTINLSSGTALTVTAPDTVLDDITIVGSGSAWAGIWATKADRLIVRGCRIHDVVYAGIMLLDQTGGSVEGCYIARIGMALPNGANAYGIAVSDDGGAIQSTGILVNDNVITDVPTWQGINSHNGRQLTITNNVVRRTRRAFWLAPTLSHRMVDCVVSGNRAESPLPVTYDPTGYFVCNSDNCLVEDNWLSTDYPHPADGGEWVADVRDYGSSSTGLIRRNTIVG